MDWPLLLTLLLPPAPLSPLCPPAVCLWEASDPFWISFPFLLGVGVAFPSSLLARALLRELRNVDSKDRNT